MVYKRGKHYHMDVMVDGVRYREGLGTTDRREALAKEKDRIGEIKAGKVAAPAGRAFSRLGLSAAADQYKTEREGKVAERTIQFETERLKPLKKYFGDRPVRTIKPEHVASYQKSRLDDGISGRTINMETGVLRRILRKAKLFAILSDFPRPFPEHEREIGKALPKEAKQHLFRVAASRPEWSVVYCAAVLAASTMCRSVELKHLCWRDVDLFARKITIRRSKTAAGYRVIPLNGDAMAALARLRERSEADGCAEPDHYIFPLCEHDTLDPSRPQKSWRTAWRALVKEAARQAGRQAAVAALRNQRRISGAKAAWRQAAAPFIGFRFHDLRHQAVTELAEAGAPDSVIEAIAGHMSKRMVDHYSHVRMAAKREAVDGLPGGLMEPVALADDQRGNQPI